MATIKAIQASSIHQIQSGQVIVDLCSVAKELVENCLDAGASSIEIRFKNHGLESIEVQDNGKGVAAQDYDTIALKHYTSKLTTYDDLESLDTFGFRGEALSSLCALSEFHIITATADSSPKGARLEFEISGKLKKANITACQQGTTVSVEKLFKNLPVRRRELEKNAKREYGKVLNLLQAYACISVNVRFAVYHQPANGKKTAVFSTKSNSTTRENIVNVYGAKTLAALTRLDLMLQLQASVRPALQSTNARTGTNGSKKARQVHLEGHISRPVFGEGRLAPDRQMFFVNSRPCQLPQVSKAINEVYKSFNVSQSPFIFANLVMDTSSYDVNVSPDKRTIMLHDQNDLLDSIKAELTALFDAHDQTVPASQLQSKKLPGFKQPSILRSETTDSSCTNSRRGSEDAEMMVTSDVPASGPPGRLIGRWVGRQAEDREGSQLAPGNDVEAEVSTEKLKLAKLLSKHAMDLAGGTTKANIESVADQSTFDESGEPSVNSGPDTRGGSTRSNGGVDLFVGDPDVEAGQPSLPRHVQDFNARMQSQQVKKLGRIPARVTTETVEIPGYESDKSDESRSRERSESQEIPAIQPQRSKNFPGPVQNAFDRMRPKRVHEDIATITVGDQTTRMVLGTPEAKRPRIHTPKTNHKTPGTSLSQRLNLHAFAAPGTAPFRVDDNEASYLDQAPSLSASPDEEGEDDVPFEGQDETDGRHDRAELVGGSAHRASESPAPYQSPSAGLFVEADDSEDEYLDEDDKRVREDAKIARLIQEAEENAAQPTEATLQRATQIFKAGHRRKDATLILQQTLNVIEEDLLMQDIRYLHSKSQRSADDGHSAVDAIDDENAETKLSLTISKSDFAHMRIIGQFNLGFILAIRRSGGNGMSQQDATDAAGDHLFIIDQHAADEKFNFERLSATMNLIPQRLVTPKELQLSAVEEELVSANQPSLLANGFEIEMVDPASESTHGDLHGQLSTRRSMHLLTLPVSKETTFSIADLEELLHLLSESSLPSATSPEDVSTSLFTPSTGSTAPSDPSQASSASTTGTMQGRTIVRPSRVRKMLAMRACRSSIMVGKTLTRGQMGRVVRHMGEMERPWNCPHGRPTMRHLAGLREWRGWDEDLVGRIDWEGFLAG